jgi:hypothetical protein
VSDYSKITNFLSKDSLALNDPAKYVKGSEIDAEYNAIAVAIATKADTASPTLTTPTMSSPTITGTITAAIANFSGLVTAALGLTVTGAAFNSRGITDSATAKALTLSGSGANSVTIANSATNPTIGTSGGLLNLSSTTVFAGSSAPVATVTGIYGNSTAIGFTDSTRAADSRVFDATFSGGSFKIRALTDAYSDAANAISIAGGYGAGITAINFSTSAAGAASTTQVSVTHTAGATRYITLTGSNGGNPTIGTNAGNLAISVPIVAAGTVGINTTQAPVAGGVVGAYMGTTGIGIYFGSGAPTVSAAKGSLYLRSDGSATNNRMYVNTDGSTTWTAVTTAA